MKKCKYHCDYGDGEYCHYEDGCVNNLIGEASKFEMKMDNDLNNAQRLKFIESYIKIGNGDYQWNDNHGELIRCKDCKYMIEDNQFECGLRDFPVNEDWFCADGERQTD